MTTLVELLSLTELKGRKYFLECQLNIVDNLIEEHEKKKIPIKTIDNELDYLEKGILNNQDLLNNIEHETKIINDKVEIYKKKIKIKFKDSSKIV
jgi:hypothetical protein